MATFRRVPSGIKRFMRNNRSTINMATAGGVAGALGGSQIGFSLGMTGTWIRNRFHSKDKKSLWKSGFKGALIGAGIGGSIGGGAMASHGISAKMAQGRRF